MADAAGARRPSVVLLARDCASTRIVYHHLRGRFDVPGVVLEDRLPRRRLLARRVRRLGMRAVAGQLLFQLTVVPYLSSRSRRRRTEIERRYGLDARPVDEEVIARVPSVNSDDARDLLRSLDPDAVVIHATRIVSAETLAAVPATFLNVHAGITPRYRGVHGGYWALAQRDPECFGVTIHVVDEGVDTGPVLAQLRLRPTPEDSFVTYPLLQLAGGLPALVEAVGRVADGDVETLGDLPGPSRLWYHPTLAQYIANRRRAGVR